MTRLIVLWPSTEDSEFDAVYHDQHVPLVRALPELESVVVSPVRSRSHAVLAELFFVDAPALKRAMTSEAGQALAAHTRSLEEKFGVTSLAIIVDEPADAPR
jgi:uncharacterized protein (TIGR02118 family)